mmetsp:Transcript_43533/g.104558  ORF Transcript_43533/g.104558 Transcript_43533/m.104558 type:complete len:207 (-) Transcript_43533:138-758(-)
MTRSAGMQLASSSYSLPLTLSSCLGLCSNSTSSATALMKSCQSGSCTGCDSLKGYCCTLHDSRVRTLRRRLRSQLAEMRIASSSGSLSPSLVATLCRTAAISSWVGAAIRKQRQRERIGAMTLHGLLQTRMSLHVAEYFSIVRRSPCCAGLLSRSTSLSTTTLKAGGALLPSFPEVMIGADDAISLMSSCTTSRSRMPASDGLSSM